jgi:hypothetical protein
MQQGARSATRGGGGVESLRGAHDHRRRRRRARGLRVASRIGPGFHKLLVEGARDVSREIELFLFFAGGPLERAGISRVLEAENASPNQQSPAVQLCLLPEGTTGFAPSAPTSARRRRFPCLGLARPAQGCWPAARTEREDQTLGVCGCATTEIDAATPQLCRAVKTAGAGAPPAVASGAWSGLRAPVAQKRVGALQLASAFPTQWRQMPSASQWPWGCCPHAVPALARV